MKNPAAALVALTHPATTAVGRFTLHEPTLGMQALLERLGSPLVLPDSPRTLEAWAATLYALTRPASESRALLARGESAFREEAFAWADTVQSAEALALIREAGAAMRRLSEANPAPDEAAAEEGAESPDPTAAGPTAGSPAGPPKRPSASAGT